MTKQPPAMKHLYSRYAAMTLVALIMHTAQGQVIYIPDTQLRAVYNGWVPGSVDAAGYLNASMPEVQTFEGAVTLSSGSVSNVNGLEAFVSLRSLYLTGSGGAMTVPALPPNLEWLRLGTVLITSFPSLPNTLRYFTAEYPLVDLPAMNEGLVGFTLNGANAPIALGPWPSTMEQLELNALPNETSLAPLPIGLKRLRMDYDGLSYAVPDMINTQLEALFIDDLPYDQSLGAFPASLRSLTITNASELGALPELPGGMDSLSLGQCFHLTSLPQLPSSLKYLSLSEVPLVLLPDVPEGLRYLATSDCGLTVLPSLPNSLITLSINGEPINCLPLLPEGLGTLNLSGTNVQCLPNIPVNCAMSGVWNLDLCSLLNSTCPGDNPTISGQLYHDVNENSIRDPGEAGCNYASVIIDPIGLAGGVSPNGEYAFGLPIGTYAVSCLPNYPFVQAIMPASYAVDLLTQSSLDDGNDFALVMPNTQDASVTITAMPSIPGFGSMIWLNVMNTGASTVDVPVSFVLDADQEFISSIPAPDNIAGNLLTWSFSAVALGEQRTISLEVHTDQSIPLGTPLVHTANLLNLPDDAHPENNLAVSEALVVGSYDPNDKVVSPSIIDASELGTAQLTYTIRFQNTGTYPAFRVVISDTLSAALDWTSFRIMASSHACNWTLFNGVLCFTFEPILLPDSASDELGSQGFVTFSMRPDATLGAGPIANTANIFFDHNAPVITNEALVDISTAMANEEKEQLRVFPVPAQNVLWVDRADNSLADFIVFDAQGRQRLLMRASGRVVALPVEQLPPGVYVVEVRDQHQVRVPFVKY